ncbi:SRPBCC family protein [Actinoalloteichus fjordicus]|uniref:Polyketide cyclase / dehydrase and lipid transport n=1 Tax=Actinoalloteichus fjordicus TaxID=1612552 RepID=A0AAC9PS72_9PSEU|nr:SRPBCC family protein [Actinoalloteichus fjordicus]APU14692.1 Polyketide cyclase / dehydrase and lipid transport [Actinoalloteichus fjordicus]
MEDRQISATRTISAPADRLFNIVADPSKHALIDGSSTVRAAQDGTPERLELGTRFGMSMRLGVSYKILNKVVEFEEGKVIGWCHMGLHVWRWEFRALDEERTEVVETFDWSQVKWPKAYELAGIPRRNLRAMQATLRRMEQIVLI